MIVRRTLQAGMIALLLLLPTGCYRDTLEQLSIIYGIAYEPSADDKDPLSATISIPIYKKNGFENRLVSAQGKTPLEIRNAMSLQTPGRLVDEKVLVLLIDQQLAKQSTYRLVGQYLSELNLPARLSLAVTETSPKELLGMSMKKMDPATGINAIIAKNERLGLLPKTNLLTFVKQHIREGQDPFLPLVGKKDGSQSVELAGLALFKDDRYVMPLKGSDNLLLFALLHKSLAKGMYESGNVEQPLRLRIERSRTTYDWEPGGKTMGVRVRIHAKLLERTASPTEIYTESAKSQLKRKVEQELTDQLGKLIRKFQRSDLDPVGFGEIARSQDRHWKGAEWKAVYPQVQFKITVKVGFDSERR